MSIDATDAAIIEVMSDNPRIGVYEVSRRLGIARGTVQARLDRMMAKGVIVDFAPTVDVAALGYAVTAFVLAEIEQAMRHHSVIDQLRSIPEVLEVATVTGRDDLWIRVVARSHVDLQRVIDRIAAHPHMLRTSTTILLGVEIAYRTIPLTTATGGRHADATETSSA